MELERRGFIKLTGAAMTALGGDVVPQLDPDDGAANVDEYGVLLGPRSARPSKEALDSEWDTYELVYFATNEPHQAYTTHRLEGWQTIPMNENPTTQVGEVRTEHYTAFFNHTFARPEAPDDKNWEYTDADVTKDFSEVELASTTTVTSTQRGNYPPGTEAVPGVAFRVTGVPSSGRANAGYYTTDDGFGVGEDTTDSFAFIRKGGQEHVVHRGDWNGYVPDGRVFQSSTPVLVRFPHLFYGGGSIDVRALIHENDETNLRTLHTFTPANTPDNWPEGPPINQPNLPIQFETSGLSGGSLRANASHYEFGESDAENRVNGEHFTGIPVPTDDWVPLMSWKKRDGWDMVNVSPQKLSVSAVNGDIKLELQLDSTLSSPTWNRPTHSSIDETAVEVAEGGSITADGERRWAGYVTSGQVNQSGSVDTTDLNFNLPSGQVVTLAAQAVSSATANGVVGWEEMF